MRKITSYIILIAFSLSTLGLMGSVKQMIVFRPVTIHAGDFDSEVAPASADDPLSEELPIIVNIVDRTPVVNVITDCVEPEKDARYSLSNFERDVVERVVMAESSGESYEGMMLVAQCILNAAELTGSPPSEVVVTYKYSKARPDPSDKVRQAVSAVFDLGEVVTDEPILFFYNPQKCVSDWHETQDFVIEVGNHRFFKEKNK